LQDKLSDAVTKAVELRPDNPEEFLAKWFAEKASKSGSKAPPEASALEEEAVQVFAKADKNSDGEVTKSELKKFLQEEGSAKVREAFGVSEGWAKLFEEIDANNDGKFCLTEFKAIYTKKMLAAGGGAAKGATEQPQGKKSKKEKKAEKKKEGGGGDNQQQGGKKKKGKDEPDPEAEKKAAAKKVKAVEKEGGKKGVEIEGAADMGGLAFFCTTLMEPDGDMAHLEAGFAAMNAEPSPDPEEERRGGAGRVGKMVFSAGPKALAIISNMPAELQADKDMEDGPKRQAMFADKWIETVLQKLGEPAKGIKLEEGSNANLAKAIIPGNLEKGIFPLKLKDDAMSYAYGILTEKGCIQLNDSSEGVIRGDFEDDY